MSFTSGQLFTDSKVNSLCDRLIYFLNQEFTTNGYLNNHFGLSGKAAYILQNGSSGNANQVVFITNSQDIYNFLLENIYALLKPMRFIKFKERLLLEFEFVNVEIWLTDVNLSFIILNDVQLQEKDKIPTILL